MYPGFPSEMLTLIRCPQDQSRLDPASDCDRGAHILEGALGCSGCGRRYSIERGILVLLDPLAIDDESRKEQSIRDAKCGLDAGKKPRGIQYTEYDRMEMQPTIGALRVNPGQRLLEFGCGTGRYTVPLANMGASVVAVDFSLQSLRVLAQRLPDGLSVGLVQADVTTCFAGDAAFDRVLATLVSNLPTREHRLMMNRAASDALKDDGIFVFSVHHQNLVNRLLGSAPAGRYDESGIYRYFMRADEVRRETAVYFGRMSCRPISVSLPLTGWTGLAASTRSRIAERIPLIRAKGDLLLAKAQAPIRPPREGEGSRPNRLFSKLYFFLKRRADAS